MIEFVIPLSGAFGIGLYCRRKSLLTAQTMDGIKSLVTTFFLPLVSFHMFSQAHFDGETFLLIAMSFLLYTAALGIGFLTRRWMGQYGRYYPFLMSSAEGGMLGIGLFQMLYGADRLPHLAGIDLGCGLFVFLVFLPLLAKSNEAAEKGTEGPAKRLRMWDMPVFRGCLAGIAFQLTGMATWVDNVGGTESMLSCMGVFTTMVTPLMLIAVGYEFTVDRETLVPAVKTCLCRILVMVLFSLAGAAVMHGVGIAEKFNYYALLLESALPATFLVAMFAKGDAEKRYVNTHLSLHALFALGVALVLKAYFN